MASMTKIEELPKIIFFEEKVGTNGIECLDYENNSNIKYYRQDTVEQLFNFIEHVSKTMPKGSSLQERADNLLKQLNN